MKAEKMKATTIMMNNSIAVNEVVKMDGDLAAALMADVVMTIDS